MQSVWKSLEEGQGACAQCISGTGDAVPGCTLRKPATGRIQKALPGSAFKVWRAERYRLRMGIHEDQEHRVGQLVTVLIHVIYVPPVNDKAGATDKVLAPGFQSRLRDDRAEPGKDVDLVEVNGRVTILRAS